MKIRIRITWGKRAKPEPEPGVEILDELLTPPAVLAVEAPARKQVTASSAATVAAQPPAPTHPPPPVPRIETLEEPFDPASEEVPGYLWWMSFTSMLAVLGGHLNISWQRSVGTSNPWNIPHLVMYLCVFCAAAGYLYLIAKATFFHPRSQRRETVRLWGVRGPLGAFAGLWGVAAMVASSPMDTWWHSAYGLDARIMTPPHVVLLLGMFGIQAGAFLLVAARINRNAGRAGTAMSLLYSFDIAMMLMLILLACSEPVARQFMHSAVMYRVVCLAVPPLLVATSMANSGKWTNTLACGIYMGMCMLLLWMLPLFPAAAKAAPVLSEIRFMVPLEFPLLLIAPAVLMDLLLRKMKELHPFILSFLLGPLFFGMLLLAQWNFAGLLQSPAARNWFFGAHYLGLENSPQSLQAQFKFFGEAQDPALRLQMAVAFAAAIASSGIGLVCGDWLRRIRR